MNVDIFKSGDKNNSFRLNAEQAERGNKYFGTWQNPPKDLRSAVLSLLDRVDAGTVEMSFAAVEWVDLPQHYVELKAETEAFLTGLAESETKITLTDMQFISLMVMHCKHDPTKAYPCDEACTPILSNHKVA